jgi:putative ABC transport system permease protein
MRLSALAWRGLAARPLRSILTGAGVALGVAMVVATLVANQAATAAVRDAAQQLLGRADLRVRAFDDAGFAPRTVSRLRRLPGVLNAAAVAELQDASVSTTPGPEEQVFTMLLLGVDPLEESRIREWNLEEGAFLDPAQPAGVLVNAGWAREHGLAPGDELLLDGRRPGVPRSPIVGMLPDTGFGALSLGNVLVFQREFLTRALEIPAPTRYVDLEIGEGHIADVQAELDATLTEPFVVETAADAEVALGRAQAGFEGLGFLFGLVALAVGAFVVANTLAMTVAERTRELGLLRAAGTTSRQVLCIFLRQGAAIAVIGSVVGALLGVGIAGALIAFLRSTRAVLILSLPIHAGSLAIGLLLGVTVTMGAAAIPAVAASWVSPLDALRPSRQPGRTLGSRLAWLAGLVAFATVLGIVAYPLERGSGSALGGLSVVAVLAAGTLLAALLFQPLAGIVGRPFASFFGAQGLLGRANIGRDHVRTGLTIGGLTIGLAAVVALGTVSASARATADRWVASILPGGYAIRSGVPLDVDTWQPDLESTDGAEAASPVIEVPAVALGGSGQREVSLAGIEPTVFQDTGALIFEDGRRSAAFEALRAGGAVLVPSGVAQRDRIGVGDELVLAVPGGDEHRFTVAGIIAYTLPARSPDGALLISAADARTLFGATSASLWAMVPKPDTPPSAFEAALRGQANIMAATFLTTSGLAAELGGSLDRLIGLFDVLALLAVVIAALGIVNTLAVGVVERAREIAILRSHGMTVGQVQAMVVTEAAIMGAVGGLAAIGIGLLVAWATVAIGAPRDFAAGLTVPWPLLAITLLLGIGVAALAGIYPARLAARAPITGNLKHFE